MTQIICKYDTMYANTTSSRNVIFQHSGVSASLLCCRYGFTPSVSDIRKGGLVIILFVIILLYFKCPPEVELPVEPAPGHVGGGDVLEALVRDHVDHGANHGFPDQSIN